MRASTTAALKTALRKRKSAREQRMREKIDKFLAAGGPGRKYEKAACFVPESLSSTSLLHGQRKAEFFLAKFWVQGEASTGFASEAPLEGRN